LAITALRESLVEMLREGSVQRVASSLNMLLCSFNFGPGMLEGDRHYDKAAVIAVTFAS
jgi:hypothetical protein